jgi:hypothetical protein
VKDGAFLWDISRICFGTPHALLSGNVENPLLWIAMNGIQTPAAREILSYFLHHPEAADSVVEIARWRLMQEQIRHSVEETVRAMQWLLSEGYVQEVARQGTERIFQLNLDKRTEAESALQEVMDGMLDRY